MKGRPKLTSIQNVVDPPWRRVTVTALPVEGIPWFGCHINNKREGQPKPGRLPVARLVATSRHLRTKAVFDTVHSGLCYMWLSEKAVSYDCVTSWEVHVGETRCGVWRFLLHRVLCENAHYFLISREGHSSALGRNLRQENDRAPRYKLSHGNFRRLNADTYHMIRRDSRDICRGAKWFGHSPSAPFRPSPSPPKSREA